MAGAGSRALPYFRRALEQWPKDTLRPECQLQDVIGKRIAAGNVAPPGMAFPTPPARETAELKQANALHALLENRFQTKYQLSRRTLKPRMNPNYFEELLAEIEEAPNRSWTHRLKMKLRGMFRLQ